MLTLNDGRSELWQWDTGRTLAVDADCSQVHFSNKVFGRSIDVDVVGGVAIIPDVLLQTDNDLNVWAFVGTAENGYTKISKTFKVNRRNKPADYVFTPPEQTTLAELVERLDRIEETQDPDAIKNVVDDYLKQNPVEVPVQSVNGQTGEVKLTADDVGAIADETDPTVPDWAKQPTKPTYTAAEVGALPDTYTPPNQTAQQVGADPTGTAASAVSQHNTDTAAHNDLRLALQGLSDRINAALDSDDTTLDQMSEVVAYIKSNKSLIDAITTSKVSVADIVNDLVTNVTDKPLSAAQGVAIKGLIDELRALIPDAYTLPTATETTLGGVKPVTATEAMTQPVGVDAEGRLMTKPGSGGSGISVTGATVGQTVKIAAVDDYGVPTAWEAVDFPSGGSGGGDVWETINTAIIEEEANSFTFDADAAGNPFSLKKALLAVILHPTSTEHGKPYNAALRNGNSYTGMYTSTPAPDKSKYNSFQWFIEANDDFVREQWAKGSRVENDFIAVGTLSSYFGFHNGVKDYSVELGYTRSIGLRGFISAGSEIRLYGVRA